MGLGTLTGVVTVGLTIFFITVPITMKVFLEDWFSQTPLERFMTEARNLLFLALFAMLGVGWVGGGGVGFYLTQQVNLMNYGKLIQGILLLGGIAFILDLLLGAVEYQLGLRKPSRSEK